MMWVVIVGALLLLGGTVAWTLLWPSDWMLKQASRLYPGTVFRVDTSERAVALTIDDAPHPSITPSILRELRANGVKATFFILGANAAAHPDLIDSIRGDGHELANHLYSDRVSAKLSDREFVDELRRTDTLIQPLGPAKWCRPGSGVITPRIVNLMRQNGYSPVAGTAYPLDLHSSVQVTMTQFLKNVRPGAVLTLHDGAPDRANIIEVLTTVLPRVREMGYRITTLSELIQLG